MRTVPFTDPLTHMVSVQIRLSIHQELNGQHKTPEIKLRPTRCTPTGAYSEGRSVGCYSGDFGAHPLPAEAWDPSASLMDTISYNRFCQ